ncbi:MAG: tRNA uridine-5-carboxymethylaminomethyl(34) synthesis enzyme MnmG [Candidatus Babeliales bacterium]
MNKNIQVDVIVVGGGHAGIEAASAAARMGSRTVLISLKIDKIGHMPCNPAVGGVGKGHIVFEISALGGIMPKLCTQSYIQARMLNTSKGAAVHGLRLQIDKYKYNKLSIEMLKNMDNLTLVEGMVDRILLDDQKNVTGVELADGTSITAPSVILTTGTFLNGLIHIGNVQKAAGRVDEQTVTKLAQFLYSLNLEMGRLKTGTPPRLARESLDFSKMEYQEPDQLEYLFEFEPHKAVSTHPCYITRTNETTHQIIRDNLHLSAMYNGNITGIGPRYCPSIEDKIGRFPDKTSHQVFVEPEGADTNEIYPNGLSTSLPASVQEAYIRSIKGFENAQIIRPGYAVEYDFVLPHQLHHTLELKPIPGLFLAGQINGTTGYEEAAGQGIIAGINASLKSRNLPPFVLSRQESYIGVMIDDLVTMGVDEPYRMFTSRAERRLLLRQDNVFARLGKKSYELGLISKELFDAIEAENTLVQEIIANVRKKCNKQNLLELLTNDMGNLSKLRELIGMRVGERVLHTVWSEIRYAPYIVRELEEVKRSEQYQELIIPSNIEYTNMQGLSKELQGKLNKVRPATIAQAALIPGMTPAAISLLIFKVRKKSYNCIENTDSGCS